MTVSTLGCFGQARFLLLAQRSGPLFYESRQSHCQIDWLYSVDKLVETNVDTLQPPPRPQDFLGFIN